MSSPTIPGLGVNVYPKGSTPSDKELILLPVCRLDRLGPAGDTLFCLVHGEAYRVDVHEAPELLHYGIDGYQPPAAAGQAPAAEKELRTFTRGPDGTITIGADTVPVQIGASFRTRSPGCCGWPTWPPRSPRPTNQARQPPIRSTPPRWDSR